MTAPSPASLAAAATSGPLPPLADSDRWLASQPPGTVPPGNLDQLLADASAQIRRYCGWHIAPVITETVRLDGSGSGSQRLPTLNLIDVAAVDNAGTALDVTTLEWSADGYMRRGYPSTWYWSGYGGCGWTSQLRGVTVTYTHGFDLDDVGQLAALTCNLVSRVVTAPQGYVTSETVGSTSLTYGRPAVEDRPGSMSLLGYEQQLLDSYRLPGRRSA